MKTSSATTSASSRFPRPTSSAKPSPLRRFSVSRTPSELGCAQSLFPLHSAVAATRMTSCLSLLTSCRALSIRMNSMARDIMLVLKVGSDVW